MASFDFLPLLVGAGAGAGDGLLGSNTIYEIALLGGGLALDYFGVNPDIGTAMAIVGAALLAKKAVGSLKSSSSTTGGGYVATIRHLPQPHTPPAPTGTGYGGTWSGGTWSGGDVEDEPAYYEETGGRAGGYSLTSAPHSGISTPGVWVNSGSAPGNGQLRPFLDGRVDEDGYAFPIGRIA